MLKRLYWKNLNYHENLHYEERRPIHIKKCRERSSTTVFTQSYCFIYTLLYLLFKNYSTSKSKLNAWEDSESTLF